MIDLVARRVFPGIRPPRRRLVELVARRDLAESVTDIRLFLAGSSLTFVIPLVAAAAVAFVGHLLGVGQLRITIRLVEIGAFFVVFLPASFSLVLALESFSGERERNTLEMLFATPLRDSEIYLGKAAAVLVPSLSLSYSALLVYTIAVTVLAGHTPWAELPPLVVVTFAQAAVMVCGATIVSSQTKTLRSANVMASFVIIPMSGVIQGESLLIIGGLEWVLWAVAGGLGIVALLLLRLGIVGFNRESILAKESRPPDPRAIGRAIVGWRPSFRLSELPRGLASSLLRTRGAICVIAALLVMGVTFGVVAQQARLVADGPVVAIIGHDATMGHEVVAGSSHLFGFILGHNLLVGLLMLVTAPFTLGVAAGLLTLLNGFVIGYVAGVFIAFGHLPTFLCGTVPHGVIELPALVLAAAFAMRVGASMVRPSEAGWLLGMRSALTDYTRAALLVIPMFVVAAFIESFVTTQVIGRC